MRTSYIAIDFICNQRCRFCPCSKEQSTYPSIPLIELKNLVEGFIKQSKIEGLVISGGEPTLHKDFIPFIEFVTQKGLNVTVLSNGETFSNKQFVEQLVLNADVSKLMVTTTIHSHDREQHEWINQTKGSFDRSIKGLLNLMDLGIKVTVKHCINRQNRVDLKKFYEFIDCTFPEEADIQLCSIDYCGLTGEEKRDQMVSFPELRPYMEEMFDLYLADLEKGSQRRMYCINMPYCAADPYYWEFLAPKSDNYSNYAAPVKTGEELKSEDHIEPIVGTFCNECKDCIVESICPGTYRTAFEYYGNQIVKKYTE